MNYDGIDYSKPDVQVLHAAPLVNGELAGRTCYNSFKQSEHDSIVNFYNDTIEEIESSELLNSLCHVYHHMSVIEHINITYNISGISRGVLQELSRHRIASYSVKSTRYTMGAIINAFIADMIHNRSNTEPSPWFLSTLLDMNLFVVSEPGYVGIEVSTIWMKLKYHWAKIGEEKFIRISTIKAVGALYYEHKENEEHLLFYSKANSSKQKRNVGDSFKHIVSDNWKTDLVMTVNLRSLENFLKLRLPGSAWFQIRMLANKILEVTPSKYTNLIHKGFKNGN
ncbi:MAG: FAD-dependent thymidylate synthase [Sulfurimonas sp.]|nr:FAD-dependent thymidylate synthase [Sulfurimonas sp.]